MKESEKLPFLGEKRIRLLGTGAKSHPHFASCPVDTSLFSYTTLQNWHPGEFDARRSTTKPTTTLRSLNTPPTISPATHHSYALRAFARCF